MGSMMMRETFFQTDPRKTDITDKTCLSNQEFLRAIFSGKHSDARPVVVTFKGNPDIVSEKSWFGKPWQDSTDMSIALPSDANNYFSLAVFKAYEEGKYRRIKKNFQALHAVMLDDIGTKVPRNRLTLPPSWLLETSPGNCQAGYLLREPLADVGLADRLMKAVVAAGLCDPGANGPSTRLARLPIAVNGKSSPPFVCQLVIWSPELHYSVDELITDLQLEMTDPGRPRRQGLHVAHELPADGDPVKPRRELGLAAKAFEGAIGAEVRLLADISRILFAADLAVREGIDGSFPSPDELVEAVGVAAIRSGDELLVRARHAERLGPFL
jgi:hypothetical protein